MCCSSQKPKSLLLNLIKNLVFLKLCFYALFNLQGTHGSCSLRLFIVSHFRVVVKSFLKLFQILFSTFNLSSFTRFSSFRHILLCNFTFQCFTSISQKFFFVKSFLNFFSKFFRLGRSTSRCLPLFKSFSATRLVYHKLLFLSSVFWNFLKFFCNILDFSLKANLSYNFSWYFSVLLSKRRI